MLMIILAACTRENAQGFPPDDVADPYISTDATVYASRVEGSDAVFEVTAKFTNRGQIPLYVATCGDDLPLHAWLKRTDEQWQEVEDIVGYACASELKFHMLTPGETFVTSFRAIALLSYEIAGFYKLGWVTVYAEPDPYAKPVPISQRTSNVFEVR